jgi:signal transduction histidine kinase/CheY-like chemotaxis protein
VPVIVEGSFWGFIGFADCQTDRQWTEHEESLLTLMAGSLGGAIIRVAKEEALRASETKFRTLYESTSTAVILLDENGIFDANSAALQMFGCTKYEQLCGKAGERGNSGSPLGIRGQGGEGEKSSTQLQEGEQPFIPGRRFPFLTECLRGTGRYLNGNSYGERDAALSPRHLLPSLLSHPIGFSPPLQPNGEASLSLANEYIAVAIAQGSCRFDWMYCKPNGEEFPAEVTLTRIELGDHKILQATIYDISDRKATERQLLQAKEAAEAGSLAKSEFLAMMSHELRTPLNAVLGLSQLMRQEIFGTLNDKQKEYVSCIQSSGEHLLALINDILDLSKVEAGKEQLTFVPVDVQELCEYCLAMVREQANEQGLKLTLHIKVQVRIVIADERRCKQMLINLLSNAVKFTPVGEVSLIVTKRSEGICFAVEDTGIGIASDQLPLLFEPFRQLDSGLNRRFPGTGLGLALTRSLAQLHGGDVTAKSTLGQGSQFTLCLPDRSLEYLIVPSLPQEAGIIEGQSCPLWAKSRILLVEKDERSALVLKDYLQVIGHRVEHLTNGNDFLQKVRQFKPNLILMDVQLGGECTGFDLLAALRWEPDTNNLKVVIVTAMAMAGDRERCLEAGADDYLSKPIGIAQLEAILMRYL